MYSPGAPTNGANKTNGGSWEHDESEWRDGNHPIRFIRIIRWPAVGERGASAS